GVSGATSRLCGWPLMVRVTIKRLSMGFKIETARSQKARPNGRMKQPRDGHGLAPGPVAGLAMISPAARLSQFMISKDISRIPYRHLPGGSGVRRLIANRP